MVPVSGFQLSNYASAVYIILLGCISIPGNALVIFTICRRKALRAKPHNMLIVNLAVSDLGVCVIAYPITAGAAFLGQSVIEGFLCTAYGFFTFFLAMQSIYTLVAISIYRYVHLCKPLSCRVLDVHITRRIIQGAWLLSLALALPPLVGWSNYTRESTANTCSVNWSMDSPNNLSYIIFIVILGYVLPIVILFFCYFKICCYYKKIDEVHGNDFRGNAMNFGYNKRMNMMCILMGVSFLVAWTPYCVVSLWATSQPHKAIPKNIPTLFAKLHCAVNPIIYSLLNSNFRRALRRAVGCCTFNKVDISDRAAQTFNRLEKRQVSALSVFTTMTSSQVWTKSSHSSAQTERESVVGQEQGRVVHPAQRESNSDIALSGTNSNPTQEVHGINIGPCCLESTAIDACSVSNPGTGPAAGGGSVQKRRTLSDRDYGVSAKVGGEHKSRRRRSAPVASVQLAGIYANNIHDITVSQTDSETRCSNLLCRDRIKCPCNKRVSNTN